MVWTHASDASHPIDLLGIDHCPSALMHARSTYPTPPFDFIQADLNDLTVLEQSHFDLVIALNTLHSPHLDGRALLRRVVKKHLTPEAGLILGFPNCRYVDHTVRFGAQTKNYQHPEYSVLLKEVNAYRRYLHQQGFVVTVTGRHTLFLTARRVTRLGSTRDD